MGSRTFVLPDLGEGLTEGEIVHWLVAVGDEVGIDQAIAEVETAKSIVEVPSPYAGTVETLHGAEGDTLSVGDALITVAEASVQVAQSYREEERAGSGNVLIGFGTSGHGATGRRRAPRSQRTPGAPGTPGTPGAPGTPAAAARADWRSDAPPLVVSPIVRKLARDHGIDLSRVTGSGPGGLITRRDVQGAIDHAPFAQGDERSGADLLPAHTTRAARVSATGKHLPPHDPGTAASSATASDPTAPDPTAPTGATPSTAAPGAYGPERRTPTGQFRKTVIAALTTSRQRVPEATVWCDVDATALVQLRASQPDGPGLLAYLARFTTAALAQYPVFNGSFDEQTHEIVEYERVNLSVAAQTDRGLLTPAVLGAESMTTTQLDAALRDLTSRAREGRATTQELTRGTFTLNNYGTFNVDGSTPIINYPQVAILGFGRIIERPWVINGQVVPRHICTMVFAFDHRVADGGAASGFMRAVADAVENPASVIAHL